MSSTDYLEEQAFVASDSQWARLRALAVTGMLAPLVLSLYALIGGPLSAIAFVRQKVSDFNAKE